MAFTGMASWAYKDPVTVQRLNDFKANDDYLITAVCKTWINFDGSAATPTSRASLNISSITDSGVGKWTINLTTGFAAGSGYCVIVNGNRVAATDSIGMANARELQSGLIRVGTADTVANPEDWNAVCVIAIGNSN